MIDDDFSVIGGMMTDEEIVQDTFEVVDKEIQEKEGNEMTDQTVKKPAVDQPLTPLLILPCFLW